ncbi:MAG: type II CAAX endopeptidase family protein [Planctomycetota bacterium]|nr:type II CAAX endopeptidase family protein [Planctomycetota bacterium]
MNGPTYTLDPERPEGRPRAAGGSQLLVWLAWLVVVLVLIWRGLLPAVVSTPEPSEVREAQAEALVDVVMRLQGRVLLAVHRLSTLQNTPMPPDEIRALEIGSVGQRQRAAVLAGVLLGPDQAVESLHRLRASAASAGHPLTEVQRKTDAVLLQVFTDEGSHSSHDRSTVQGTLSGAERSLLKQQLGWFGELTIARTQPDAKVLWTKFQSDAMSLLVVLLSIFFGGILLGLLGLAGLVVGLVLALKGRLRGLPSSHSPGLFIETFAVWLVTFLVLSELVAFLQFGLFGAIVIFFVSLVALAWLPIRGMSFSQALGEIGLTWGRGFWREIGSGFAGFLMMLPILLVGVTCTLLLVKLAEYFGSNEEGFRSDAGPAHPIFAVFVDASVLDVVVVFLAASVAAPIVEEVAFRGLLYRHLRDGSRRWLPWLSIAFAALLSGFIFAAIHPQGWMAIPALGSIGVALALAREWRSSLVAPMVMHGLQNGLVMCMVLLMVG